MTLHEAIERILIESEKPLKAIDIANAVNENSMYIRADGSAVPQSQIHARINRYPRQFFKTSNGEIGLYNLEEKILKNNFIVAYSVVLKKYSQRDASVIFITLLAFHWYKIMDVNMEITFINKRHRGETIVIEDFIKLLVENYGLIDIGQLFYDLDSTLLSNTIKILNKVTWAKVNPETFLTLFHHYLIQGTGSRYGTEEFVTPPSVARLIARLVTSDKEVSVYNPGAGSATLASSIRFSGCKISNILCTDINDNFREIGSINLFVNGFWKFDYLQKDIIKFTPKEKYDLVISNPPFGTLNPVLYSKDVYKKSNDYVVNFIYHGLSSLKETGQAIFIVNSGFLTNNKQDYFGIRKKIVEEGWLQAIINLPTGLFKPATSINTSLLLLKKDSDRESVLLIDASEEPYCSNESDLIDLDVDKIVSKVIDGISQESGTTSIDSKKRLFVTIDEFRSVGYSFSYSFYSLDRFSEIPIEGTTSLGELVRIIKLEYSDYKSLPFINIRDLSNDNTNFYINPKNILQNLNGLKGRILDKDAILIGRIAGSYKPSIFIANNNEVLISSNIIALEINRDLIDMEYLVSELKKDYVVDQLNILAQGVTNLKAISQHDLLRVKIRSLNNISEQKEHVEQTKKRLNNSNGKESRIVVKELDVHDIDYREIWDIYTHEYGNSLAILKGYLKNLKSGLVFNKMQIDLPISGDETDTIDYSINSALDEVNEAIDSRKTVDKLFSEDNASLEPEAVNLPSFIRQKLEKKFKKEEKLNWIIAVDDNIQENQEVNVELDKALFERLINNFAKNAIEHGIPKTKKNVTFYVNINTDDENDFVVIDIINDGNQFPQDFSLQEFLQYKKSYSPEKQIAKGKVKGIGGFIIGQVIRKHNAKIDMLTPETIIYHIEPINNIPQAARMIRAGVHFQITLPKYYEEF